MEKLLLLHGAIGAQDHLQPLADLLKDKYEIMQLQFSGHGGNAFSEKPFSIAAFADEVYDYLKERGIASIAIFGYSMGGYVAMHLAKNYPGTVKKIVTLATKFYWDEEVAAKEVKMLNAARIEEKLPAFAKALEKRHAPNDWKEVLSKTGDMLIKMGKSNPLQLDDYASLQLPCLIMLGDKDRMISLSETTDVYQKLPDAQMAMLPRTQHPIEQVNLEALVFLVKQFV